MNKVQICNLALTRVSARRIQALTDNIKEARECNNNYDMMRDLVLEEHNWKFASKRQTLSLLTTTFSGWQYAYIYPTDCLKARKIFDGTGANTGTSYDIDSDRTVQVGKVEYEIAANDDLDYKMILTDKENAELTYTAKVTDANLYPAKFASAVAYRLASELAISLKSDPKMAERMYNLYQLESMGAAALDANEDHKKPDEVNSFVQVRS